MASGNVLTVQTSSTGNLLSGAADKKVLGFLAAGTTAQVTSVLALRNSTSGSTLFYAILASSGGTTGRFWAHNFPGDGIYFKDGLTVSSMAGLRSVTLFYQ